MCKGLAFLSAASLLTSPAAANDAPNVIGDAADAAATCVFAAGKEGVDKSKFEESDKWVPSQSGGFKHPTLPIEISFPQDPDGIARICVVNATLNSQTNQSELLAAFKVLFKKEPITQSNSEIWMFGAPPNVRGLQVFPDNESEKPEIRLIGAAF